MKLLPALLLVLAIVTVQDEEDPRWIRAIGAPQFFAVVVEDVDRSAAWYAEVFGLEEVGGSEAEDGSWRIVNLRSDALFVELVRDARAVEVEVARGFRKVGFFVPDIDAAADRIEAASGTRPRVLDFEALDLRLLQLRDPDGNVVQLQQDRK